LEQQGIIVTKAGAGAFVANLDSNLSRSVRKKLISEELERIAVDAFHMQIEGQTLLEWFNSAVARFNLP
jgi:GntR family transcriptional regulator